MGRTRKSPQVYEGQPYAKRYLQKMLREKVIPWAQQSTGCDIVDVTPPLLIEPPARIVPHDGLPLSELHPHYTPSLRRSYMWDSLHMESKYSPMICVVLEGEADLRIGITENMVRHLKKEHGVDYSKHDYFVLSVPQKSFVFVPADGAGPNGGAPHWERPHPENAYSRLLWIRTTSIGAFCNICLTQNTTHASMDHVIVPDTRIHGLMECFREELLLAKQEGSTQSPVTAALLLAIMLRLQSALAHKARPFPPHKPDSPFPQSALETRATHDDPVKLARIYIEENLQADLKLGVIAAEAFVSPSQINRLFTADLGLSVMKYVNQRRIENAKSLLLQTGLLIHEVGALAGIPHPPHFSHLFQSHVGVSPRKFRKMYGSQGHQLPEDEAQSQKA
jgi:AraC-like DNA-binding protein